MTTHALRTIERVQAKQKAGGAVRIGDLIGWNVNEGAKVSRERLRAVVQSFDPDLGADLAASAALGRAVRLLGKRGGHMVRSFNKPNSDALAAYGVYLVTGNGESGDDHRCGARVRVAVGQIGQQVHERIVPLPPEHGKTVNTAWSIAEELAGNATWLITNATSEDISTVLVAIMKKLGGSPLRNRGGLYMLPLPSCDQWEALMPALRTLGVEPIRIEMHDCPDNVQAARNAAKSALEDDLSQLLADLEKANLGPNERGRQMDVSRRIIECHDLAARASLYRNVLTSMADQIEQKCAAMAAAFKTAENGLTVQYHVLSGLRRPLLDDGEVPAASASVNKTPAAKAVKMMGLQFPVGDDDD